VTDWQAVLNAAVKVIGFVLTIVLSGVVILFVKKALDRLLKRLIGDDAIAKALTALAVILLILKGLTAALRYVTQAELRYLHTGLTGLLNDMASVIQWTVLVAAILFVGYTVAGWRRAIADEE